MEYFFDRDPVIFKNIAEFYRDGKFHLPSPTAGCMEAILDELKFLEFLNILCRIVAVNISSWETKRKEEETKGTVVLLNISAIVAETVPTDSGLKLREAHANVFFGIDSFCVGIFTIEYVARLYSAPQRLDFVREMSNVIDLLGIVPYYIAVIERAVKSESSVLDFVITIFRMFRVFRVTKLARHSERFQTLLMSVQSAGTELGGILFSFLALMVTFSSMMYYFERKEDDTKFISIPAACWYTLVTMTTLGYGDMFPTTVRGKLLGAACALMGVLLLSLPVPIIERKLDEYAKSQNPRKKMQISQKS
ncbi:hypothetical protein OS493_012096 [Desmophyllum pertusum]|uniref:Uncharacterized protein n=1 Tax=Desmophyllum pertusum TaxID=174260 RepID=A0A9X0A2U4_9CNID|nr:hypothetical protein OS493_012096 [Desmophyllum pertusum]